jgi:hypothetical protein
MNRVVRFLAAVFMKYHFFWDVTRSHWVVAFQNYDTALKSRRLRWAGHVARMGERRGAYRALVGKPEGRKPLGRPRRRWEDNIKMDLREIGCGGADWIDLAQDRDMWRTVVNTVMNLLVP